ncbi:MAG: hypothetical protein RL497_3157 [Pseudomonadota bacterium]|jgi:ubiquinone biosynthesis protein UbiJ
MSEGFAHNSLVAASLRATLEAALNLALSADPASQQKLIGQAGKSIALNITDLNLNWCVHLNYPLIILETGNLEGGNTPANSLLTGRLQDFIGLSLKHSASLSHTGISHSGDIQLLNSSINLFKNLDIDLGEIISNALGPLSGALVDSALEVFLPIKHTLNKAPQFLGDYLQHEVQLIPSKNQLDAFTQDIHQLRSNTDRLSAKIQRLNTRLDQALHSVDKKAP